MREDFLHYLWKYQKIDQRVLTTVDGIPVKIVSPGIHNYLSGPDFFNARLFIGDQEWAGNVEIHLSSSHWYVHGHQNDPAYDNVILHVVWEHDVDIYRKDDTALPVVEIRNMVLPGALSSYENLCSGSGNRWINCENDFRDVDGFLVKNWLERLYLERLEQKTFLIHSLLEKCAGDWEAVLFQMLARNFGLNINGEAFLSIATSIPFGVIRKTRSNKSLLEALLLGQGGLLDKDHEEPYFKQLKNEYDYLRTKYGLSRNGVLPVKYFRLRPDNFPEIRLAQLAAVYHSNDYLFSSVERSSEIEEIYDLFEVHLNGFWSSHYTFSSSHGQRKKMLTRKFMNLLIINTIVPVKFSYLKSIGKDIENLFTIIEAIAPEENQVIKKFRSLDPTCAGNALQSQALLQLKKEYCEKNACLQCAVGMKILQKERQI